MSLDSGVFCTSDIITILIQFLYNTVQWYFNGLLPLSFLTCTSNNAVSSSRFFFFFYWHYNPLWVLTFSVILFHSALSLHCFLHRLIPIICISSSMSAVHLFLGLPLILVPIGSSSRYLIQNSILCLASHFMLSSKQFLLGNYTRILTHCGRVTQICVFNTVKLGTSASSP